MPACLAADCSQSELPTSALRDRASENVAAAVRRAERMVSIRQQRDNAGLFRDVFQVSQALILCGLPYEPTPATQIIRKARLGDGSIVEVTFSATLGGIDMPFGSDRTVLHFLLDLAVKRNSRFVSWRTAQQFLDAMKMNRSSGENRADLRARFERIRGLTIGVMRTRRTSDTSAVMPVIRRACLPTSIDIRAEQDGQARLPLSDDVVFGVEIGQDFFEELVAYHVCVPRVILQSTRKQSQLQDCMLFLCWRSFAAENESVIPWGHLREQLWQKDKQLGRIRERFTDAIKCLEIIWPEMRAESRKTGLWIAPPLNGIYLDPNATSSRRLSAKQT